MTNIEPTNIENPETNIKPVLDAQGRSYATGKRKTSIAKIWLSKGTGKIVVNGKDFKDYFKRII